MYQAIIVRPEARKHPNADKLQLLCFNGCQVITGAEVHEGQLFCFFPEGGQLSDEFLFENSEFRPGKGINKDPTKSGMFDESGRVRCIRLRKEASEGYCVPLSSLAWTGDVSFLKEGDSFDTLNGHTICRKYVTRAVKEAIEKAAKAKRVYFDHKQFEKHFDTSQLREFVNRIPLGAVVYFTEKIHACVSAETIIETLEYGPLQIKTIVDTKLNCHIKVFDTIRKEILYAPIDNWYYLPDSGEWYEIELEDGTKLEVTSNNPIWLPELNAYREVSNLAIGDILLID